MESPRASNNNDNSGAVEGPDRLVVAVAYLYPFLDSVHHDRFLVAEIPFMSRSERLRRWREEEEESDEDDVVFLGAMLVVVKRKRSKKKFRGSLPGRPNMPRDIPRRSRAHLLGLLR
ncbi:hypothetical protein EJB05_02023, partial [Eragrostis curvula]